MVTTGGRGHSLRRPSSPAPSAGTVVLGQLLFEGDDRGLGAEVAGHVGGQIGIERLVDGGENAARQQAGDQVLGANSQLLRQVLHADAFRNGDAARDRQRLAGKRKPRRRNEALHRAFLHATRNIALSRTRRTSHGTLSGRRRRSSDAGTGRQIRDGLPGAPERVGCGPRRSPGRIGGRVPGAPLVGGPPGRGRWKIGLPRSGMARARRRRCWRRTHAAARDTPDAVRSAAQSIARRRRMCGIALAPGCCGCPGRTRSCRSGRAAATERRGAAARVAARRRVRRPQLALQPRRRC